MESAISRRCNPNGRNDSPSLPGEITLQPFLSPSDEPMTARVAVFLCDFPRSVTTLGRSSTSFVTLVYWLVVVLPRYVRALDIDLTSCVSFGRHRQPRRLFFFHRTTRRRPMEYTTELIHHRDATTTTRQPAHNLLASAVKVTTVDRAHSQPLYRRRRNRNKPL